MMHFLSSSCASCFCLFRACDAFLVMCTNHFWSISCASLFLFDFVCMIHFWSISCVDLLCMKHVLNVHDAFCCSNCDFRHARQQVLGDFVFYSIEFA